MNYYLIPAVIDKYQKLIDDDHPELGTEEIRTVRPETFDRGFTCLCNLDESWFLVKTIDLLVLYSPIPLESLEKKCLEFNFNEEQVSLWK